MFRQSDKMTLSVINVTDKNGKIIDLHLPFPIKDESFEIPKNIVKVSIFEYHQNVVSDGFIAFNIYVGKITTLASLAEENKRCVVIPRDIKHIDDKLCYYTDLDNKKVAFAKINPGDKVVADTEELHDILLRISRNFAQIKNAISSIKDTEQEECAIYEEDDVLSKKRLRMCISRRKEYMD